MPADRADAQLEKRLRKQAEFGIPPRAELLLEAADTIAQLRAERDKWLDAFNRSEQFQDGPTKRAEAAESQLAALRAALEPIARSEHERAVGANALFSVEHWKHNAGQEHPHEPDDDSFIAFENCKHPLCASVSSADPRQVEPVRIGAFDYVADTIAQLRAELDRANAELDVTIQANIDLQEVRAEATQLRAERDAVRDECDRLYAKFEGLTSGT